MNENAIADYANKQDPARTAICNALQAQINSALPQATSKVWHGSPVWFIGREPVAGYSARKQGVVPLFWNGQRFEEPELEATGTFHAAQYRYDDVAQIDAAKLAGWLAKAGTNIWDSATELAALRAAYYAAKKKDAAKKAKAKAPAKRAKAVKKVAKKAAKKAARKPMKKSKAAPKKRKKSRARKK